MAPKAQMKKKKIEVNKYLFCKWYHQESEKTIHRIGEKYLQIIFPVRDFYPEYIKYSYNLIMKWQPN